MTDAARRCPVPGCHEALGQTRQGDPWLMCRRHYFRLDNAHSSRLWRAYRSWQRLERQRLRIRAEKKDIPPALLLAIAAAMSEYLDVRTECIESVREPGEQLELAN